MKAPTTSSNWRDANQRYLVAALAVVRSALQRYAASLQNMPEVENQEIALQVLQEAAAATPAPSALDRLCRMLNLSTFDCQI